MIDFLTQTRTFLLTGNALLFSFWWRFLLAPFSLPDELNDDAILAKMMEYDEQFELRVKKSHVQNYNDGLEEVGRQVERLGKPILSHKTKQWVFWGVRLGCAGVGVWTGSVGLVVMVSLLQFLFLPYSLFVSVAYGLETVFVLYTGHVIVWPVLVWLFDSVFCLDFMNLTITPELCLGFLVLDQTICALCLWKTPKGKTAPISTWRIVQSVVYGFLNCKTFFLVLLPLCFGVKINIAAWMVDAFFGLSARISARCARHWQVLFYQVHRMGHLKHVYQDAHRFHHYLHDSTAFDAHIFGSGAPEEWLILMVDVLLGGYFGVVPGCLSYHVLGISLFNKWGFHTRVEGEEFSADNFHADHAKHIYNFGFSLPHELLMMTIIPKQQETDALIFSNYKLSRKEENDEIILIFDPLDMQTAPHGKRTMSSSATSLW